MTLPLNNQLLQRNLQGLLCYTCQRRLQGLQQVSEQDAGGITELEALLLHDLESLFDLGRTAEQELKPETNIG